MMRDPVKTIGNLIDKQKTAYISSIDKDGYPEYQGHAGAAKEGSGIQVFYFTSNTSSMRAAQYRENPKACI